MQAWPRGCCDFAQPDAFAFAQQLLAADSRAGIAPTSLRGVEDLRGQRRPKVLGTGMARRRGSLTGIAQLTALHAPLRTKESEGVVALFHLISKENGKRRVANAAGFFKTRHNFVARIRILVLKRLKECFNKCARSQSHPKARGRAKFATKQNLFSCLAGMPTRHCSGSSSLNGSAFEIPLSRGINGGNGDDR